MSLLTNCYKSREMINHFSIGFIKISIWFIRSLGITHHLFVREFMRFFITLEETCKDQYNITSVALHRSNQWSCHTWWPRFQKLVHWENLNQLSKSKNCTEFQTYPTVLSQENGSNSQGLIDYRGENLSLYTVGNPQSSIIVRICCSIHELTCQTRHIVLWISENIKQLVYVKLLELAL